MEETKKIKLDNNILSLRANYNVFILINGDERYTPDGAIYHIDQAENNV